MDDSVSLDQDALSIEPLSNRHDIADFECGRESLNRFLQKYAAHGPRQGLSQTWVVLRQSRVVEYFTLSVASVTHASATARLTKGMPQHDLPVILLARLAVHSDLQGQGLGGVVLEHALRQALALAEAAQVRLGETVSLPVRAVLVHALDERAAGFYAHWGLERSPTDPLHLMVTVKDLKASLREN